MKTGYQHAYTSLKAAIMDYDSSKSVKIDADTTIRCENMRAPQLVNEAFVEYINKSQFSKRIWAEFREYLKDCLREVHTRAKLEILDNLSEEGGEKV
jgi:hypothetical protein